jgi:diguanylate cyclase (GGDEF)-like protein
MLAPLVGLTDVASLLLLFAAFRPVPLRMREALVVVGAVVAACAGLGGLFYAAALAALAALVALVRLIELHKLMKLVGTDVSDEHLLAALKPYMAPRLFRAGETIFTRGDKATSLFYLVDGSINLPEINEHVPKGQLFGEIALFTKDRARTLGAKAETDVHALEMQAGDLINLVRSNPQIGFFLIGLITQRLTHDFSYLSELFYSAEAERRQLFELATRDGLTGVSNRRALDERVNVEWAHAMRSKRPISIIILDIDHFKQYNDTFGHGGGDVALKTVAQALAKRVMRRSDLFARYGGEEFSAVLPGTNFEAAMRIAETMRASVAALGMPHPKNESGIVTISAGVATQFSDHDATLAGFLKAADDFLYRAKEMGRNRVEGTTLGSEISEDEDDQERIIA